MTEITISNERIRGIASGMLQRAYAIEPDLRRWLRRMDGAGDSFATGGREGATREYNCLRCGFHATVTLCLPLLDSAPDQAVCGLIARELGHVVDHGQRMFEPQVTPRCRKEQDDRANAIAVLLGFAEELSRLQAWQEEQEGNDVRR